MAWTSYGWDSITPMLQEMREIVEPHGSKLAILVFPVVEQVDDACRALDLDQVLYPQRRIASICTFLGVTCLDLTEPLYTAGGKRLFRDYFHLNEKGNDVVAAELIRFVGRTVTSFDDDDVDRLHAN